MIAVDASLLVYAHRADALQNERAYELMQRLATSRSPWGLPWPCLYEFFAIATHPRIYDPPSTAEQALGQIDAWLESPSVVLLTEPEGHWETVKKLASETPIEGPRMNDARIAALCIAHGVSELWTADSALSRYPALKTRNPL
jgi:hypothetical protein